MKSYLTIATLVLMSIAAMPASADPPPPANAWQFVDRILRPCGSGATPYVSAIAAATGDLNLTTCVGRNVTVNGVPIGGGGGTPGGSNLQVQYNNAGAFGGTGGITFTNTGQFTFAEGTIAASVPFINHTVTWNSGATNFVNFRSNVTNTNSNTLSYLFDWQIDGTSAFRLRKDGILDGFTTFFLPFTKLVMGGQGGGNNGEIWLQTSGNVLSYSLNANRIQIGSDKVLSWAQSPGANDLVDVGIGRNAAGVVEINSGAPAGTFASLRLLRSQISIVTVATLPTCNAGAAGTASAVNDALAPAFLTTVVGGGAVVTPVFCNGTNWIAY